MTTTRKVLGICDICGFRYKLRDLKKTSYGAMVCPIDYERYDLHNHPQNKVADTSDNESLNFFNRMVPIADYKGTLKAWLPS